ncbi:Meiotic activator RIM4 [Fusarium austroafricanum]|uniref:Meiotic activator RIM4 n=1 Tax=Fusarium austroafricanum TaxID=2364996 RepID=A0A8H4NXD8_9HYPO|nr:Meiotic activator RIM4 [Fusarium austroafricanum]
MPTQEYRTPHVVASSDLRLRNAHSSNNINYSGNDSDADDEGSPMGTPERPLSNSKSMPSLPKVDYDAAIRRWLESSISRVETQVESAGTEAEQSVQQPITKQGSDDNKGHDAIDSGLMTMTDAVQAVAALPADVDAIAASPPEFDAQALYPGDACVFVANLTHHFDDLTIKAALTKYFGMFGTVFVKVKRDRRRMPFAFVQYTEIKHANVAVHKARGERILGRPIRVEKCGGNLAYIIFRKNSRPVQIDEARTIFAPYGPIEKIAPLDLYAQKTLNVPPSLLVQFSMFDPKRDVIRGVGPSTPFLLMAFDPKMVRKSPDRPDNDRTFMELYEKDCRSAFFGGLPTYANEDMIRQLASNCGKVISVDMRYTADQNGGLPHPFAFVQFEQPNTPDEAVRQYNGQEIDGCRLKVERKRPKQPSTDTRMYPSPLRPMRPHRRINSMAATPSKHHRMFSTVGISQTDQDFIGTMQSQGMPGPESSRLNPPVPLPPKKLPFSTRTVDDFTPLQSPDKHSEVANTGTMVHFAPSPGNVISPAGSSPIHGQQPVPSATTSPPHILSFKDRMADAGRSLSYAFSPAAEHAADRCEVAAEDKNAGKGHRRATSMFIARNTPVPIEISESEGSSSWRESGTSDDEQEFREKKAKSRARLHRSHLSEENLKRNLLAQAQLKRAHHSEEHLRGRRDYPPSRKRLTSVSKSEKSLKIHKSHKSIGSIKSRKSDATERPPEGQVVLSSQQPVYQQPIQYNHMMPQYPPQPPMYPMGYMPIQPQAMASPAPGGFTYMDMPYHTGPQYPMFTPSPQYGPPQMFHGQPQVPYQTQHQEQYREPVPMSQDARLSQPENLSRPQYQGRRFASYAHGNYDNMGYHGHGPMVRGQFETDHQRRQRAEAERYRRYNS